MSQALLVPQPVVYITKQLTESVFLYSIVTYHSDSFSQDVIFTKFYKKIAFRENIIVNGYTSIDVVMYRCFK